jgi:hypothetical protein
VRVDPAGAMTGRRGRRVAAQVVAAIRWLWSFRKVVRRRDQSPFASACGSAAPLEAFDRAVELDLAEDGLDGDLSLAVERAAFGCGKHASHEVVKAAVPAGPGPFAQSAVGRNQHLDSVGDDVLDLALVPVAGVGEHDLRGTEAVPVQFATGRRHHRLEVAEVG